MNGVRSGLSADMARRAGVRCALAPLALALVMVGTLAASVPVVALTQADTEPVHRDFSTPDMSQSEVNRDQPRAFERMTGLEHVMGLTERPADAVLAVGETRADSQFTSTILNPDGSHTTTISVDPVNWQDESGAWRPFDDTIAVADEQLAETDGVAAVSDAGPFQVRFSTEDAAADQGRLVELTADGATVEVLLPGTTPDDAAAVDDVMTFTGADDGVDLRYSLEAGMLKEEIVLAAPPAEGESLSFPFELRIGDLVARRDPADGSVDLLDADGTIVFHIPPSFMVDGDETLEYDERISTDVVTSLSQIAPGRVLLDVRPDADWLRDPARTYPVIIDPTFHYGNGRSDTASSTSVMIQAANPTTNYNGVSPLTVGKTAGGQAQEALVTFPSLDVIPRDATIVRATLDFTISSGTSGMGLVVMRNTSTWSPSTVTWNTKPGRSTQKSATAAIGANSIVLTQLAHQWARGNYANHGIGLQSSGSNGQNVVIPASGAGSPALTITYIKQLRLGIDDLYSYTSYDYGGGTVGYVNTATGNLVLQHEASAIGAPGFTVALTHTFNGQDPYGQKKTNPDSWAVYGEGWSFSQDLRLFEIQGGDATVFKDGTGRIRVFTQLDIVSGTRTHTAPIQYGYTLVKDVNNPVADANKVWTLTATSGGEKLFFDANGKLKRREDRNGNHLTYAYDGSDRLSTITDEIGRTTTFTWTAPGSPNRLYRITDMAGRIFEYGYDSYGNLITIKDAVGTSVQRTTTYGYAVADQLATVTNPNGNQSVIDYGNLHGWESSTTESWQMAAGSTGTVVKSTDRAYTGSGSLKATLGSAGVPLNSEIVRPYSPAKSWNSAPQEMIAWIWLSSGAPAINVTMRASNNCSSGTQSVTAALTANAWNEVHLESVDQDPTCPLTELGLRFQTPGGQSYTTPIYVDHMYMRGLTVGVREASGAHTIFQEWSWDPANRQTTIGLRDAAGTMQPTTHRYTEVGQVDRITDPYSDVTTMVFDGDWRMTSITYPGSPTRTDTHTYPTGRMEPLTSTIDGDTSRMGVDATSGDLRYEIDPVNEARRAASQAFVATIHDRDAAGNVTSTKLNWYAAGANLDTIPFPTATSTLETTSYTYTANGETATTTDPRGIVARDEWDTAGRHTKHIDNFVSGGSGADQNLTTTNVYDTTIIAGKAGWVSQTTDPIGAVTALTYDALGHQLTSTTTGTGLGSGITVTTTTDANGSVTTETLDGIVTERTHDVNGRPTKVVVDKGTGKLNLTTEHAYDLQGNQIATKDPRGTIGRSWYDANGRLTRTVQNCTTTGTTIPTAWETCTGLGTADATWNLTTTYGYDAQGNQTSEIAPNGRETRHGYDVKGQRVWTTENFVSGTPTSADQNLTTWFYTDDRGRDVATKAPTTDRTTFIVTRRVYDEHGRVMSEIVNCTDSGTTPPADPATCTGAGTVNATTNITTTYAYDAAGNQLAMTAPKPSDGAAGTSTVTTRYAHDGGGRLCRVLENATVDLQSLAVPCTTAVTGTTTSDLSTRYTYDAGGNMTSMVDARGNTQSYAYDAAGRMTGRTDGLSASVAWTYDKRGNRLTQANRVGSPAVAITWTYDSANRMKTRVADLVTTTYGYDANGSLTSAQGPAGTMSTTFDRLDRPTSVTPDDGSANTTWSYSFTAPSRADASGTSTFALDKHGRETSATLPLSASAFTTAYRADGSPSTRTDPNANTTTHGYDTIGRLLTKVTTGSGGTPTRASLTYTYNRASQRLSEASTVTGDPANGTASFTYDAIGRLTAYTSPLGTGSNQAYGWQKVPNRDSLTIGTGTPSTLTYDAADRMTTSGYTHDADGRMTGQPGQTLVWDSLGRLKEVRNSSTNALISAYTYDALDRLRTVARGSTIRFRYVGTSTQVSEVVDNGTNASQLKVGNGWGGERLATWTGTSSTPRYLGTNGHGDVTWSTDGSGAVVNTLRYDPWGNVAAASGSGLPDWRFQGSWNDTSTGLSWVVTRWYAPGLGRFVSEDSLLGEPRNPMSRHLIAYAEGDPVGGWDPDGRQTACTVDIKWVWLSCEGIKIGLVALAALATAVGTVIVSKIAANPPAVIAIPRYKYVVYPIDYYKFDTKLKCANIGERQSRVNLFTWLIAPCHTMPRIIGKMPRPEKLGLNQLWISQQIRARSIINDIGPCVSPPSITSPYYGLERGSIRAAGYPRLTWFGDNNPWEAPPPFAGGDCPYVP